MPIFISATPLGLTLLVDKNELRLLQFAFLSSGRPVTFRIAPVPTWMFVEGGGGVCVRESVWGGWGEEGLEQRQVGEGLGLHCACI